MSLRDEIRKRREEIVAVSARHGARNVRIFGSVVRGDERDDSDIDFLVDMEPGRSIFDLGGLAVDLEDIFQRRVDVVTEKGLHWYLRAVIVSEAEPV